MGYSYSFRLTVDEPEQFEQFRAQAVALHNALKTRTWFPAFGTVSSSSSQGYGTGPNDELLPEFLLFTTAFPLFTFKLWMTYWDHMQLYMVELRDDVIVSTAEADYDLVDLMPGAQISISLDPDNLQLENEITDWFE